jgi:phage replication-related protein YjqB (UPF0714/DUF867 family)
LIDKYNNFEQLLTSEKKDVDFRRIVKQRNSPWLIVAPHGGGIEPGTSELAAAIARFDHSLYTFEGIKKSDNRILHITSTNFDDPHLLKLLNSSKTVITIHGCSGNEPIAYVGGLEDDIREKIIILLSENGIKSDIISNPSLQGRDENNICNKGLSRKGVQIELSEELRRAMFISLLRTGRRIKTKLFKTFVNTIRTVIKDEQLHNNVKVNS